MAKKKEKISDFQGELLDQLIRESGGPQALFDKGGVCEINCVNGHFHNSGETLLNILVLYVP